MPQMIINRDEIQGLDVSRASRRLDYRSRETLLNKPDSHGLPRNYGDLETR